MATLNQTIFNYSAKLICLVFAFLATTLLYSQGEAANWYFGRGAGVNFKNGTVKPLDDGVIGTNEGSASISNTKGELLFYTDGVIVWDRNHSVMPNGRDLLGNKSSTQSAVIVPKPGSDTIYYIFTVINLGNIAGVRYSEVDIALNSGNGDVTSKKNILLTTPSAEKISAVKHANGNDYWVATHGWDSDEFSVFKVTEFGVDITPVKSSVGSYHGSITFNSIGAMKYSPNGKKLALAKWGANCSVEIFDFDNITGVISNPIILDNYFDKDYENGTYGIEFSPNSNLLYVSEIDLTNYTSKLHQFNLKVYEKTAILNSDTIIYSGRNLMAAIQLAFDGKIYVCNPFSRFLSVIENPNLLGVGCNYLQSEISLGSKFGVFGLPSFIQSLFVATIEVKNICLNGITQFSIKSDETIDYIIWDFGDTGTSSEKTPTHDFLSTGSFIVKAKIKSGNCIINVTKEVIIYQSPTAYKAENYVICEDKGNDGFESFDLKSKNAEVLESQSDTDFQVSYFESYADAEAHLNELGSELINKKNHQEIYARVSNLLNPECYDISSFLLIIETAIAGDVEDLIQCIQAGTGNLVVDLSQFDADVFTPTTVTPHTDYVITYHLSQSTADLGLKDILIPNSFETKSNNQDVYTRLENNNSGFFTTSHFKIIINEQPIAYQPSNMYLCDDSSNDGKAVFDLKSQTADILKSQTGKVTFHTSQTNADLGLTPLDDDFENETISQEIFVRLESLVNSSCYDTTSFYIEVNSKPIINLLKTWYLCPGESLQLYVDSIHDEYLWSNGKTDSEIIVDKAGTYTVTVYNIDEGKTCSVMETIQVFDTELPNSVDVDVKDWTSTNNSIKISVEGAESYQYSLDGDVYQSDNMFNNLEAGDYLVYVKNDRDCLVYTEDIYLLNYPKFFTPNNDGYNDYWKINFAETEPDIEINIFDRYGKLLFQLNPLSKGWDGTLNGQLLNTSDYWFVVDRLSKNKQYRGHFTLKR